MENRTRRIKRLQLILNIQCVIDIRRISDGQVRAVRIVRNAGTLRRGNDSGEILLVMLGQTIRRRLGGGRLQIIEIPVELLVIGQTVAHMIQNLFRESLCLLIGQIRFEPSRIQADLVHSDQSDR